MATRPRATTTVSETAGAPGAGLTIACVMAPVPSNDDYVPRLYGGVQSIVDFHGYSEGAEYAAFHFNETGRPVLFIGLPIDTPGEVSNEVIAGNSGTSVITISEGADGCLTEHKGILKCTKGGTIGTDQIVLSLSLDGGETYQTVRLGTGNAYTVPFVGISFAFAAGTLVAGDTLHTWDASGPLAAVADFELARAQLKAQQKLFRSALFVHDAADATFAQGFVDMILAYDTSDDRFINGRISVPGGVDSADVVTQEDAFESVDGERIITLHFGRGRKVSPLTGWKFRRPNSWAAMLREYQHDVHISTNRRDDGNTGWSLWDADGALVEYDDRVYGDAASAARFTSFTSLGNGPGGAFISVDVTRSGDGKVSSLTHNSNVINLLRTLVQRVTAQFAGRSIELNADGTATSEELAALASEVNSVLATEVLADKGEGKRASLAVWTPNTDDILNVAEPTLTGVLECVLNGTIHNVATTIRIKSGGQ